MVAQGFSVEFLAELVRTVWQARRRSASWRATSRSRSRGCGSPTLDGGRSSRDWSASATPTRLPERSLNALKM
jgi:hypothetical protein